MANITRLKTWNLNETLTSADLNAEFDNILSGTNSGSLDSDNIDQTDTYTWSGNHTFNSLVTHGANLTVGVDDTGHDVQFFGATAGAHLLWDESADTLKMVGGAKINAQGTVTVGVDDTGYDVKFFGATTGKYMLWDESADTLAVVGTAITLNGTAVGTSDVTLTGSTNNTIATVTGADALQGEANLTFDGTTLDVIGNAGVGIARTDGTLHVHTATAGTIVANAVADDLVIENNSDVGISLLSPNNTNAYILAGDPTGGNADFQIRFERDGATNDMTFYTSATERMRIDSSGNVGIGNTDLASTYFAGKHLLVGDEDASTGDASTAIVIATKVAGTGELNFTDSPTTAQQGSIWYDHSADAMIFRANTNERMRIDSSGKVGIGETSPDSALHVNGAYDNVNGNAKLQSNNNDASLLTFWNKDSAPNAASRRWKIAANNTANGTLEFAYGTSSTGDPTTVAMGIDSSGNVGIGVSSSLNSLLHIKGESGITIDRTANAAIEDKFTLGVSQDAATDQLDIGSDTTARILSCYTNGNVTVAGALSKGSGSFRIRHPLPEKGGSDLVHSFIEGPQADLIYRGVVELVAGSATVNIDTAARMTEGTFVALCGNVQSFTSNESDTDAVWGSVAGNILTITSAVPTCTASISWLVIGERIDAHMLDTDWTDESGRVITEPVTATGGIE